MYLITRELTAEACSVELQPGIPQGKKARSKEFSIMKFSELCDLSASVVK
jgi:hypothetical protein